MFVWDVGRWNFKGFGVIDFRGGWFVGIGVVFKFKRLIGEVGFLIFWFVK